MLLQPNSTYIIIRRDVNFDENILAYKPDLVFVPSSTYELDSVHDPSSSSSPDSNPYFIISLDDDIDDENPSPLDLLPLLAP
jgi:hypothetical protein